MIEVIPSEKRHHFENEWLSTNWHFSFDDYHDPRNMFFGPLRVFNDDIVQPESGFPTHPHREMEIVTYVIDGALEHRDQMGNRGVVHAGEVQRMSAGTGIRHSEFNRSKTTPVHLLQLWILPSVKGSAPSWEQKSYSLEARKGKLLAIAEPAERARKAGEASGAVSIQQDATIFTSLLAPGEKVSHQLDRGRRAYVFVIEGKLDVNGKVLTKGDQARIAPRVRRERQLKFKAADGVASADFLLLDLP
ncbi:MAG: pirin family protein [Candidatus Acidiferrales bacterium]